MWPTRSRVAPAPSQVISRLRRCRAGSCVIASSSTSMWSTAVLLPALPGRSRNANDCWVGPGRPVGIAPGGFPRPARRTRRATLAATGSPRVLPVGSAGGDGCRVDGPRGRDLAAAVAVAGHRDAGSAGEDDPVVGKPPPLITEAAAEVLHPETTLALVFGAYPPHQPTPRVGVDRAEDGLGHPVSEVPCPPGQHLVQAGDQLVQVLVPG